MYDFIDDSGCMAIDLDSFLIMQDQFEEDDDNDGVVILDEDFFDEK